MEMLLYLVILIIYIGGFVLFMTPLGQFFISMLDDMIGGFTMM